MTWHPVMKASPVEWEMTDDGADGPHAIIRRLVYGRLGNREEWFRVVTYHPESAQRELVGYWPTLEEAAEAAWDLARANQGWLHHLMSKRVDPATVPRPSPQDLLAHYRAERRNSPA